MKFVLLAATGARRQSLLNCPDGCTLVPKRTHFSTIVRVHALKCFGTHIGTGNPALVIENGPPEAAARQEFARERILPCAFIDGSLHAGSPLRVDYYYPHARMQLCVHSTLAVAAVLFGHAGAPSSIALDTAMRHQRLFLTREGEQYFVRLDVQETPAVDITLEHAAQLLRVSPTALASAPQVGSVGSPKLLVELSDTDVLYDLNPDLHGIIEWSREHGLNGVYAWCRRPPGADAGHAYEGRNFNHLAASLEDSATGAAAGALCSCLGHDLLLYQGRAIWHDCLIRARHDKGAVLVGGTVETTA